MNLRPFVCSVLALLALASPLIYGAEARERAFAETMLCSDVAPEDAALFEHYFGSSAEAVAEGWDSENLVSYGSSWCRNRAGRRMLVERIKVYSEDGTTMRELRCERFKVSPEIRRNYLVREYRAVVPFVFINNLVQVVDYDEETLYVIMPQFNPETRRVEKHEYKQWTRRVLNSSMGDLTEEDTALFDTCFPLHKLQSTSLSWDAEHRVVYSARESKGSGGAYALTGVIKQVAADGSNCRVATKTIEVSGEWNHIDRPCAQNLPMVQPFVFVELQNNKWLHFHIEKFNPQTGEYEGYRTKTYDFRSLELIGDIEVLYPSLSVEVN